jgi:hypothetical protein
MTPGSSRRSSWRVSGLIWSIAYAALALGTISAPADTSGVRSVALGGGLLWVIAYVVGLFQKSERRRIEPRPLVMVLLILAGAVEALGATWAQAEHATAQATWFALALGFALAGLANARRREPSDGTVVCQLFFHGLMIFPALSQLAGIWLSRSGQASNLAPLTRLLVVIAGVATPLLFVTLLAVLVYDLNRPTEERDHPSLALLAVQAAYVVAVFRWAQDGI